jgi:hypothetical protein
MIVHVADAHAHVQRLASVAKMATVLEEFTTEEQRYIVLFLFVDKRLNAKHFHKKCFRFTAGSVRCVKWFTARCQKFR